MRLAVRGSNISDSSSMMKGLIGRAKTHLKAIFCVCVVFTNPFTSIVEEHVQWQVLLLEVVHKGAD